MQRLYSMLTDDPLWYKDAIIYELHIKAFFDSDGNGIGDIRGLTHKLDYLQDLGVTAIWLLPFYPSPLRDDGYDIADYYDIHPSYGDMHDFKELLREAHKRGLRIITELVLNHTSDQHLWFQKARRAKAGSATRDFYVWSDTAEKYKDARIIFQDFESSNWSWDPVAKAYYWHRFYSHQPDLNYDNPQVRKAMFKVIDFWLGLGVDGVRLDAVPYLFEREGTNCENLPETYEFLRMLRTHVDDKFKNRMLLAEANQWPEDAVAYMGKGDMCHMAFHFPIMPRMFMALQMEDSFPIIDIMDQTPAIPENCQWALFLRNHDELTLEMVTDEERDYMYRIYATDPKARINVGIRRRLAPLLDNDKRKIRLLNALLFTLPGTPIIYYGDEIGMGDNYYLGDRDGVRTPMQWSPDRNAGFSKANPHQLYLPVVLDPSYHYSARNVETQERSQASTLWGMRHLIAMRKHFKAFSRGSIEMLYSANPKVLAFIREYNGEKFLMAANLSRHSQMAALNLPKFAGFIPQEMFSKNKFLPIQKDSAYPLTFSPYGWYLFSLQEQQAGEACIGGTAMEIDVGREWSKVFEGQAREQLEQEVLPAYLTGCRWFGGKARDVQELKIIETMPIGKAHSKTEILLMQVEYTEGLPDLYVLPLAFADGEESEKVVSSFPQAVVSRLKVDSRNGVIYDALYNEEFCGELLSMIARRRKLKTPGGGELTAFPGPAFKDALKSRLHLLRPQVLKAEQSNTSILYGNEFFLKVFRHPDRGVNPDLEIIKFLTERSSFKHIPRFAGGIEYKQPGSESISLCILQEQVRNEGDSWSYFLEHLSSFYERVLAAKIDPKDIPEAPRSFIDLAACEAPSGLRDLITSVPLEMAALLGKRTAELHLALATEKEDSNFAPEPFSLLWQRSIFQSMQSLVKKVFRLLERSLSKLPEEVSSEAREIFALEDEIVSMERLIARKKLSTQKMRYHGDYHLGQVLFTGKDFVIIDFEGEPARTLGERRLKRSPLRDAAGMLRSFHYAAYVSLLKEAPLRSEDRSSLEPWAELWSRYIGGAFLRSYFDVIGSSGLVPGEKEELELMLKAFLLDKAVYELGYELNNRPQWVIVPMRGIKQIVKGNQGEENGEHEQSCL